MPSVMLLLLECRAFSKVHKDSYQSGKVGHHNYIATYVELNNTLLSVATVCVCPFYGSVTRGSYSLRVSILRIRDKINNNYVHSTDL